MIKILPGREDFLHGRTKVSGFRIFDFVRLSGNRQDRAQLKLVGVRFALEEEAKARLLDVTSHNRRSLPTTAHPADSLRAQKLLRS
jgi:hypothetical protein